MMLTPEQVKTLVEQLSTFEREDPGADEDRDPVKMTRSVRLTDGRTAFIWEVPAGSGFLAEDHAYAHDLYIVQGSGRIKIGDVENIYENGSRFHVPANVPHCISYAYEDTAVLQVQWL